MTRRPSSGAERWEIAVHTATRQWVDERAMASDRDGAERHEGNSHASAPRPSACFPSPHFLEMEAVENLESEVNS